MLEVRNLTRRFHGRAVVDDVSFVLHPGEVTGYLGPNGAGKSTTVKMITGLLRPTGGSILFNGRDIREDLAGFKRRLGYVPEEPNLYSFLTGLEYLELAGGLRELDPAVVRRRAEGLLLQLGLEHDGWAPVSSYSKGMKQRLLIAAALLHDPDLLIFDEAQSGLDIANALLFRNLIGELAARGKAVLYISHVLELVEKVCSRVIILHKGKIAADDSISSLRQLMNLPSLEEIFSSLSQHEDPAARAGEIARLISA